MHAAAKSRNSIFGTEWNSVLGLMIVLLVLIVVVLFIVFTAQPAQGQTYKVLYNFTRGPDGAWPDSGMSLIIDEADNLFGTTYGGGDPDCSALGCGVVFELMRTDSDWALVPLYAFDVWDDGLPLAGLTRGSDDSLYGTTRYTTVFSLKPSISTCRTEPCSWAKTVLYHFQGNQDGSEPYRSPVTFDNEGSIYVTASGGGTYLYDTVVKLTRSEAGWHETTLYSFRGGDDGTQPLSGVIFDQSGNLYGTTMSGGGYHGMFGDCGTVFKLTPSVSGWTEQVLYHFRCDIDGGYPMGGLIFDGLGNLYGTTAWGGVGVGVPNPGGTFHAEPVGWRIWNNQWRRSIRRRSDL